MDAFATAISIALQYGVPLDTLCDKFSHTRFEPQGFTTNPDIRIAKSITDYIFRWLALKFLPAEQRGPTPAETLAAAEKGEPPPKSGSGASVDSLETMELAAANTEKADDVPGRGSGSSNLQGVEGLTRAADALYAQAAQDRAAAKFQTDAPPCPVCGSITVRSGACYKCGNCGATTGCS
jgi:ribonucleoside-diphosphate reductase alpha chain